jgi:hypothetical protein
MDSGKRDGMDRAWEHANTEWKRVMLICALEVAKRKPFLNTDDLEHWRSTYYPNHTTHENRAIGPIMREAAKLGYCTPTLDWVESRQKVNHSRPMRVWFSLVYQGPGRFYKPRRKPVDPRQFNLF